MPNEVPYTPGFGLAPPILAGRDDLVEDICGGISAGPGHPMFVSAVVGHRGVGKTSLLDVVGARIADELDWPVVHRQAMRGRDLLTALAGDLVSAAGRWAKLGRTYKHLEKELTVKVNLGVVSGEAAIRAPGSTSPSEFDSVLSAVGGFAAEHDTGILLTIDEASSASRSDLAALAGSIQTEVNRKRLPVAVLFSGLPSFREAIAAAGTFAERLSIRTVEDLNSDAARLALVQPAADRGIRWDRNALDTVVIASAGHPYYLQLFGFHAWEAAREQVSTVITLEAAEEGLARASRVLGDQFEVTWTRLRPQEQDFLRVVARQRDHPPVSVTNVAAQLGRTTAQLDVARSRLIHAHGLLRSPARGTIEFASEAFAAWVYDFAP